MAWVDIFIWWLILQILGWAALPLAFRLFKRLPERGYTLARPLGLLVSAYLLWTGAMTGVLDNTTGGILLAICLLAGLSAWLLVRSREPDGTPLYRALPQFLRQRAGLVLVTEALFLAAFLGWSILRAYTVGKIMYAGGEKFMEMAFMNGILNSPRFPPLDAWLSGFSISYYYFGYVMMAFMTRLSGSLPGVAFDLYDALLFALTVTGAFGIIYNLIGATQAEKSGPEGNRLFFGLLGPLFVALFGNLEGVFESLYARGFLPDSIVRWLDIPGFTASLPRTGAWLVNSADFWSCCWRASRVLQDVDLLHQPVSISPITEFPAFSFLLGDNHPHVLALPFVMLCIGVGLNFLYIGREQAMHSQESSAGLGSPAGWAGLLQVLNPIRYGLGGDFLLFVFSALILGSLGFLNTWDFPIYLGLAVLAYAAGGYLLSHRLERALIRRTISLAAGVGGLGVLFYILFYVTFSSQAGGLLPDIFPPTRLPQFLVMFGPFILILVIFLLVRFYQLRQMKGFEDQKSQGWGLFARAWAWIIALCVIAYLFVLLLVGLAAMLTPTGRSLLAAPEVQQILGGMSPVQAISSSLVARLQNPWLFLLLTALMALALSNVLGRAQDSPFTPSSQFASLMILAGLALALSVEFVYLRDSFGVRMNTVFKFYYQAWILTALSSAYAAWWLLQRLARFGRVAFALLLVSLVLLGLVYPLEAGYVRVQGFQGQPNSDGASEFARDYPDDWAVIQWLRQHTNSTGEVPTILEAPGKSYNYEGRISVFTGDPAVLGWAVHELQWRGTYAEQALREVDIAQIYTSTDSNVVLTLLKKWQVEYVVLSEAERQYVTEQCKNRGCDPSKTQSMFTRALTLVFTHGQASLYAVP